MQLRNITGGQIALSVGLIFVGIVMIYGIGEMVRLADNAERIAPAADSIGAFLAPSTKDANTPQEVPVNNVQREKKVQDLTTVEIHNMKELTQAQLNEIKKLQSQNFTTQAIWNQKNNELCMVEEELDRRIDSARRQQAAIDKPTKDQDPNKLRRGLYTINQNIEAQRKRVKDLQDELAYLQRILDNRTRRISKIVGQ